MARKTRSESGKAVKILREVEVYLRTTPATPTRADGGGSGRRGNPDLFWPGGPGGGGRRRGSAAGAVVKPHRRTSRRCVRCGQFHTTAEHGRHGDPPPLESTRGKKKPPRGAAAPRKASPRKKAAPRRARARARSTARPDDDGMVAIVLAAMPGIQGRARVGDSVFISEVYRRVGRELGVTLPEFKHWLIEQNRRGRLVLSRMDLVDMVPERLVSDSEIHHLNAEFHLIRDPSSRNHWE